MKNRKFILRFFSLILSFLMILGAFFSVNVFAEDESKYHAYFKLEADKKNPKKGDTVKITVSLKTDYPVIIVDSVVTYDSRYYSIVGSGSTAVKKVCDYSCKFGANTDSPEKMYPPSYSTDMIKKYKLVFVTMQWLASYAPQVGETPTDKMTDYVNLYTFSLKVKSDIPEGEGSVWMDSSFIPTKDNKLRTATKVSRGGDKIKYGILADVGQTIDLSKAKLFYSEMKDNNDHSVTVNYKKQLDVKSVMFPDGDYGKKYTWESSDESIATVENGVVTGVKTGSTYIVARSSDGKVRVNCKVDVKYSLIQWFIIIFLFGWIWYLR